MHRWFSIGRRNKRNLLGKAMSRIMGNLFNKEYGKKSFIVSDMVFENQTTSFLSNVTPKQEALRLLLTLMAVVASFKVFFLLQLLLNAISQAQISRLLQVSISPEETRDSFSFIIVNSQRNGYETYFSNSLKKLYLWIFNCNFCDNYT